MVNAYATVAEVDTTLLQPLRFGLCIKRVPMVVHRAVQRWGIKFHVQPDLFRDARGGDLKFRRTGQRERLPEILLCQA
jgi:hypothetical protein